MNALRKKLEGKMNERLKLREQEHNEILQRYQNAQKQLGNQQTLERNKLEKIYKTAVGAAQGRSVMGSQTMSKMGASRMKQSSAVKKKI